MLTRDTLFTGREARGGLIRGIQKASQAVGVTMGSAGKNSILEDIHIPGYRLTNDGISILESIRFADPIEEMGRKILFESVSRSNKSSGDGSSTTCVLTAAIIEEGLKLLDQGKTAMDLKRELEFCIPIIEEGIKQLKKDIPVEEVGPIAAVSAEDDEIGKKIQEIYTQIGKEGIIHWDISKTTEDSFTIGKGITVETATYASPYMCDATESGQNTYQIRIANPKILLTKQKIASSKDLESVAEQLFHRNVRDLLVFCDEFEPLIIPDLVRTRMQRGFRIVIVKMPVLWKGEWFEDLSLASGAKVAGPDYPLKNIKIEDLGTFQNIHITKESTYIDGISDLSSHIKTLEEEATDESKLRASRLNTKTARYYVGGISDSYISHRRYKVEDAIAAAWHALNGGAVIGGGVALNKLAEIMPNDVLKVALTAPHEQIKKNMGGRQFTEKEMEEQNIYDPATIVLNAAKNSVSVAANILTAETLVLLPREEQMHGTAAQVI